LSDQRSASIRTVPFTDLFRIGAPAAASAQTNDALNAAAAGKAFAEGETAARSAAAEARAAQAAGHDRTIKAIETRHAAAMAALQSANDQSLQAIETAWAESLVAIAIAIARSITEVEPAIAGETVQSLLREALAALPEGAAGTLFLPPGAPRPTPPAGWHIAEDPTLPAGTLRARADASVITASLDRRFAQLGARLAGLPA